MYKLLICNTKQGLNNKSHPKYSGVVEEINQICEPNEDVWKLSQFQLWEFISEQKSIFNKARKVYHQVECVYNSEVPDISIVKVHEYVLDVLTFARYLLLHYDLEDEEVVSIKNSLSIFKLSVINVTDLKNDALLKLLKSAKLNETLVSQHFHLYLDILWVLFTTDTIDVKDLITQLAYFSFKSYEKERALAPCFCINKIWLRLQFYLEQKNLKFWDYFNEILTNYDEEFTLSLLSTTAHLQCFDYSGVNSGLKSGRVMENLTFLSQKWVSLLDNKPNEHKLQLNLSNIKPLILDIWIGGSKQYFFSLTWDYFYENLDNFEIKADLIELAENIKEGVNCDNSFKTFLNILSIYLANNGENWIKFKKRIYKYLIPSQFKKLTEKVVFNMALVLVTISYIDTNEIPKKLQEGLECLPEDRQLSFIIWKLYISLMELNLRNNQNIESLATKLTIRMNNLSVNRTNLHLISTFVLKLEKIISSSKNHTLNQNLLFGNWMKSYLQYCQHSDLINLLNTLIIVAKNISEEGVWYVYENEFITNILIPLKNTIATKETSPGLIGTLAAVILSNSPDNLEALAGSFSSETTPYSIMLQFFHTLSGNVNYLGSKIMYDFIKAWFYCGIIGKINLDYTQFIFGMNVFRNLNLRKPVGEEDIVNFIKVLPQCDDREVFKACFNNLDKWLLKYLSLNSELVTLNIYSNMSEVFLHCAHLIYNRSSSICNLSKIVDILLFSAQEIRPNGIKLQAIEKTWANYVKAIYAINNSDPYMERLLKNLIVKYIIYFDSKFNPLKSIAYSDDLLSFSLKKISIEYLIQSSRPNDEQLFKSITTIITFLDSATLQNYRIVITTTFPSLFEVYMFKNKKGLVLDAIRTVTKTDFYKSNLLSDVIRVALLATIKKHLCFNSNTCFQLLIMLANNLKSDLKRILSDVEEEIYLTERKRGLGYDTSLRQKLYDLKALFT